MIASSHLLRLKPRWNHTPRSDSNPIGQGSDLRFRLATVIFLIESRFGTYDRKLLEWTLPILESYKGPNPSDVVIDSIRKQLALPDEQIAAMGRQVAGVPGGALSVKKYHLPYIDSRFSDLGIFDEKSRALILDIRAKLNLSNEEVDQARFYFELTYSSGVSDANHVRATNGVTDTYRNMTTMARTIVDRIDKLIPRS